MTHSTSNADRPTRRSLPSVVAVGVLFLVLGALDAYQGAAPLLRSVRSSRMAGDDLLVLAIGIAALVGGTYVLRGHAWARWLLAAWMALHVAISVGQPTAFVAHLVIFGCIAYLLFRPGASAHFGAAAM